MSIVQSFPAAPAEAMSHLSGRGFVAGPTLVQRFSVAFGLSSPEVAFILEVLRLGVEPPRVGASLLDTLASRLGLPRSRLDALLRGLSADLVDRAAGDPLGLLAPFLARMKQRSADWYGPYALAEPIRGVAPEAAGAAVGSGAPDLIVVTGFLGSGKTTLVNMMLRAPAMAASLVIINEVGEAAVDHLVVEALSTPQDLILMRDGCLCCAFGDSLSETIRRVVARRNSGEPPHFDRLIIETSGIADPIAVVHGLQQDRTFRQRVNYRGVCTTIDSSAMGSALLDLPEVARQIEAADWIVLTKTRLVDPEAIPPLLASLRERNPAAHFHLDRTASIEEALLPAMLGEPGAAAITPRASRVIHSTVAHDEAVRVATIRRGRLDETAARLFFDLLALAKGDDLFRLKGVLALRTEPRAIVVQAVRANFHEMMSIDRPSADTALTIIARNFDPAAADRLLTLLER
jgi:G3E family GTPase